MIMRIKRFLPPVEMTAESRSMGERGAAQPPLSHHHVNDGTSFRPKGKISFIYSHFILNHTVFQIVMTRNNSDHAVWVGRGGFAASTNPHTEPSVSFRTK